MGEGSWPSLANWRIFHPYFSERAANDWARPGPELGQGAAIEIQRLDGHTPGDRAVHVGPEFLLPDVLNPARAVLDPGELDKVPEHPFVRPQGIPGEDEIPGIAVRVPAFTQAPQLDLPLRDPGLAKIHPALERLPQPVMNI